jgi:hypothetical protein
MKIKSFDAVLAGLDVLKIYEPVELTINPIPASFPNGAPNHSSSAYISVEIKEWPVGDIVKKGLEKIGWKEEQEGLYWIYRQ